ncbi:MAG: BlaI/MecI/CopY family transcriptional regulator [Bacteroidales bacterium]|nr:BlaI/MecI/CopY family transcriptional regulator [Bacteroidales bacterium]MDZ4203874.1 BlaI/MecI/CopY family transcriptional regulator [Bacteroidales bacterium]
MKELTKAEEQVMQVLWKLGKGFVNDLLEYFDEPKPAYTTVSTVIRILEKKGFVNHKAYGKTHEYFPTITKKQYAGSIFSNLLSNYFGNSYPSLASFLTREENLSLEDLEVMRKIMDKEIDKQKSNTNE